MAKKYRVVFETSEGETVTEAEESEYLLDVAAMAGLDLPSTCLMGWCLTCAARILEGEVDQSEAFRFYSQDADEGFVLLCSARARSDLRIRTHQKKSMQNFRRASGLPTPLG